MPPEILIPKFFLSLITTSGNVENAFMLNANYIKNLGLKQKAKGLLNLLWIRTSTTIDVYTNR